MKIRFDADWSVVKHMHATNQAATHSPDKFHRAVTVLRNNAQRWWTKERKHQELERIKHGVNEPVYVVDQDTDEGKALLRRHAQYRYLVKMLHEVGVLSQTKPVTEHIDVLLQPTADIHQPPAPVEATFEANWLYVKHVHLTNQLGIENRSSYHHAVLTLRDLAEPFWTDTDNEELKQAMKNGIRQAYPGADPRDEAVHACHRYVLGVLQRASMLDPHEVPIERLNVMEGVRS